MIKACIKPMWYIAFKSGSDSLIMPHSQRTSPIRHALFESETASQLADPTTRGILIPCASSVCISVHYKRPVCVYNSSAWNRKWNLNDLLYLMLLHNAEVAPPSNDLSEKLRSRKSLRFVKMTLNWIMFYVRYSTHTNMMKYSLSGSSVANVIG